MECDGCELAPLAGGGLEVGRIWVGSDGGLDVPSVKCLRWGQNIVWGTYPRGTFRPHICISQPRGPVPAQFDGLRVGGHPRRAPTKAYLRPGYTFLLSQMIVSSLIATVTGTSTWRDDVRW